MEPLSVMSRIYAYLNEREYAAAVDAAEPGRGGLAKFVREAVQEKIDRDRATEAANQVKEELASLVEQMREEVLRMRQDLAQDTQRHLALIREDANKSLRKSEESQKVFLQFLGGSLAAPDRSKSPNRRDDDGPPAIPG